jgi:hypothetical protein
MASADRNKFTFTYQQVTAWREQLFDNRSLRISVEELGKWPLGRYLWAAVLQAAHLNDLRGKTEHQWQTPAWDFGRFAKAHPLLVNLDENRALIEIKRAIGREFWTDHLQMDTADAGWLSMAFGSSAGPSRATTPSPSRFWKRKDPLQWQIPMFRKATQLF